MRPVGQIAMPMASIADDEALCALLKGAEKKLASCAEAVGLPTGLEWFRLESVGERYGAVLICGNVPIAALVGSILPGQDSPVVSICISANAALERAWALQAGESPCSQN
jgi:hypothetical protein